MAAPCTRYQLIADGTCFTANNWTAKELKAIEIGLLALALISEGGTDYIATLDTTLTSAANDVFCGMTSTQLAASELAIYAGMSGAPITKPAYANYIKCAKNLTDRQIEQNRLFLLCALKNQINP
jgi:hypothetical protein